MSQRLAVLCLIALAWVLCPAKAQAETAPFSAAAEKLFAKGIKSYAKGQYTRARDAFAALIKQPLNQRSSAAQLMLGRTLFHLGEYERALQVAQRLEQKYSDSPFIPDACLLGGDCAYTLHRYAEAALLYGRVLAHSGASLDLKGQAAERLAAVSGNGLLAGQARERLQAQMGEDLLRESLAYGTVRWYQRLGWEPQRRAALKSYRRQHAGGSFGALLAEDKAPPAKAAPAAQPAPPRPQEGGAPRLGLLLPLSGPNAQLGRELLEGAQLANGEQGSPFELVPVDTGFDYGNLPVAEGEDSELVRTARAIRGMIQNERVLAAVGPVFSGPAVVAAVGAEAAGLPLVVPLAQQSGLDSLGRYTFQLRSTPEAQGRALGEYAALVLGLRTLVVLAPLTDYGWSFEREFTEAAQARGGRVVYRDWYLPGQQKDFTREFAEIRRVGLGLRPPVPDSLQADDPDIAGAEEPAVVDAIDGMAVVVESFEDARTIAPQVHFHQVRTQMLGNDIWYDPEALGQLSAAERQDLQGCVFVSGRDEGSPAARLFEEAFRRRFGRQPLYASYGYDAARLVIEGWQAGRRERRALRDWLAGVQGYAGASGRVSFGQGQQANTELEMMKISRRGQIVPADQPEEPEAPPAPPEEPSPGEEGEQ